MFIYKTAFFLELNGKIWDGKWSYLHIFRGQKEKDFGIMMTGLYIIINITENVALLLPRPLNLVVLISSGLKQIY